LRLRDTPEDFRVDEEPLYPASGTGEHTFVRVEKRLRTTEQVARDLARAAGARPRDVGYAGRKDRVAVATQWFSVPGLEPDRARALELSGARVLEAARHPHKLRTGQLRSNRFELWLRDVPPDAASGAGARLTELVARGFPNRFGAQRFGRDADNALRARRLARGELRARDRREARFLVSAWQAEVFNDALATRPLAPDAVEAGDLAVRHESGGLFWVEDADVEAPRAAAFEISATGPIFGSRMRWPRGAPEARERAVLARHGVAADAARIAGVRVRGARRALRCRPGEARLERHGGDVLLCFRLPPGSFATVFVEELFGPVAETRAGGGPDAEARSDAEGAGRGGMLTAASDREEGSA